MKKNSILFLSLILLFLLPSCKKVTKCNLKRHDDYYIAKKYLENKEYVDYVNEQWKNKIGKEIWYDAKIEVIKIRKHKVKYLDITHPIGFILDFKDLDYETCYNILKNFMKSSNQSEWEYYFGGNFIATKDIISYAIMYGEPINKNNLLYYNNSLIDNNVYLCGFSHDDRIIKNKLYILDDVTCVLSWAFMFENDLTKLHCNDKLKYIGERAFSFCKNLKFIQLNDGILELGYRAFADCENLKYVVIPNSVEKIASSVFTYGVIFCEQESKPEIWANDWATKNAKVYWRSEWEYNSEGIPVPISE